MQHGSNPQAIGGRYGVNGRCRFGCWSWRCNGMGFAHVGSAVTFIDTNTERVQQLRDGAYAASTTLDLTGGPAFVFLTLPTPNVGNHYELSAFKAGTQAVGEALRGASDFHTIVVRPPSPRARATPWSVRSSNRRPGRKRAPTSRWRPTRSSSARHAPERTS